MLGRLLEQLPCCVDKRQVGANPSVNQFPRLVRKYGAGDRFYHIEFFVVDIVVRVGDSEGQFEDVTSVAWWKGFQVGKKFWVYLRLAPRQPINLTTVDSGHDLKGVPQVSKFLLRDLAVRPRHA